MMRMARGSGIAGLAGMAFCSHMYPRRPTPQRQQALLLVRPLLDLAKYDLYAVSLCSYLSSETLYTFLRAFSKKPAFFTRTQILRLSQLSAFN